MSVTMINLNPEATTTNRPTLTPYKTAKYYSYQEGGIKCQPIGGDKLVYDKDKKTWSLKTAKLDFTKVYIQVVDDEGNFLMGGTFPAFKLFKLGKCAGFGDVINIVDKYNKHANALMEQMKRDGTFRQEYFKA